MIALIAALTGYCVGGVICGYFGMKRGYVKGVADACKEFELAATKYANEMLLQHAAEMQAVEHLDQKSTGSVRNVVS